MGDATVAEIKAEFEKRIQAGEFIEASNRAPGRAFTTSKMIDHERNTIQVMRAGQNQHEPIASFETRRERWAKEISPVQPSDQLASRLSMDLKPMRPFLSKRSRTECGFHRSRQKSLARNASALDGGSNLGRTCHGRFQVCVRVEDFQHRAGHVVVDFRRSTDVDGIADDEFESGIREL